MEKEFDDNATYVFEYSAHQMRKLESIRQRLYAEKPLSGDERRNLANLLDSLLHSYDVLR